MLADAARYFEAAGLATPEHGGARVRFDAPDECSENAGYCRQAKIAEFATEFRCYRLAMGVYALLGRRQQMPRRAADIRECRARLREYIMPRSARHGR